MNSNNLIEPAARRADEERSLLERIGQRDSRALSELYQYYAGPLYSYAYKMLSNHEDAEEVLQDTFVRIWKKAAKYDGERSKPFTWSVMIARGLTLDRLRRRNKKSAIKSVPLDVADEPSTSMDDCVEHLFFNEASRQVQQALQTLPEVDRRCLELVVFSEVSHSQIAQETQQPLGTVKARIRRGLVKLRIALERHGT